VNDRRTISTQDRRWLYAVLKHWETTHAAPRPGSPFGTRRAAGFDAQACVYWW